MDQLLDVVGLFQVAENFFLIRDVKLCMRRMQTVRKNLNEFLAQITGSTRNEDGQRFSFDNTIQKPPI
jgi:hypothetical protein